MNFGIRICIIIGSLFDGLRNFDLLGNDTLFDRGRSLVRIGILTEIIISVIDQSGVANECLILIKVLTGKYACSNSGNPHKVSRISN